MDELEDLPPLEAEDLPQINSSNSPRRGKSPKKPGPKPKAKSPSTPSASYSANADRFAPAWEKQLRQGYAELFVGGGAFIGMAAPVTGAVFVSRGPDTAEALVRIARRDERVRAVLLTLLQSSAYVQLGGFVACIAIAVQVDMFVISKGQRGLRPDAPPTVLIRREIMEVFNNAAEQQQRGESPTPAAGNGSEPIPGPWTAPWAGNPAPQNPVPGAPIPPS